MSVILRGSWRQIMSPYLKAAIFCTLAMFLFVVPESADAGANCQQSINDNKVEGALNDNQLWDAEIGCSNGDHMCSERGRLQTNAWTSECENRCAQTSGGSDVCIDFCMQASSDCF